MVPNQNNIVDIINSSKDSVKIYDTIVSTIIKTTDKYEPSKLSKSQNSIKRMNALISMYIDGLNSSLSILTAKYNGSDSLSQVLGYVIEEEKNENGVVISTKTSYRNIEAFQALSTLMTSMVKTIEGIGKIKLDRKTRGDISKNISLMVGTFNFAINEILNEFKNIDMDRLTSIIDMLVTSPETVKIIDKSISNNSREGNKINSHLANDIETIKSGSKMGILDILTKITELISGVMEMKFPNPIKFQVRLWVFGKMFKSAVNSLIHIGEDIQKENDIESLNTFRDIMYTINSVFIEGDNEHEPAIDTIYQLTNKMSQMLSPMIVANKYGFPQLRQLITNILSIDRGGKKGKGKKIDSRVELVGWSKTISITIKSVIEITDSIKKLSVSIIALNPATALAIQIGLIGFESVLNSISKVVVAINNFVQRIKNIEITDISDDLDIIKNIILKILVITGEVALLALTAIPLAVAFTPAELSLLMIAGIVWTIKGLFGKFSIDKEFKTTQKAISNIYLIILETVGTILLTAGALLLISYIAPVLIKSAKDTALTTLAIAGVVLVIAGLAWLINRMFRGGVGKTISEGLLLMISLIGVMLLVSGQLLLFAYAGVLFFGEDWKGGLWSHALTMFGVVAGATLAIGGLGYLLTLMLPGIAAFAISSIALLISIGALLLTANTLIELAEVKFEDDTQQKVQEKTKLIIDTAHDIMNAMFRGWTKEGEDYTSNESEDNGFKRFFKSMFKGSAMIVEILASSIILVSTFVSVTMIYLTAAMLESLGKITLDQTTITSNVGMVIGVAHGVIDSVLNHDVPATKGTPSEKKGPIRSLLNGIGDFLGGIKSVVDSILTFGFLAMTMVSIGMVTLIAKNLKYIEGIELNQKTIETKVQAIVGTANSLIDHINSSNINKDNIKKVELTKKFMEQIEKTVKHMSAIGETNNHGQFDKAVDSYVKFVDKINTVKLENLQTATNMFEKMAEFSKSISGNFEGLADTINEKIMPLLEQLNEGLKNTNGSISNVGGINGGVSSPQGTSTSPSSPQGTPTTQSINYSEAIGQIKQELSNIKDILTDGSQITRVDDR